jgi:hypothetical protein
VRRLAIYRRVRPTFFDFFFIVFWSGMGGMFPPTRPAVGAVTPLPRPLAEPVFFEGTFFLDAMLGCLRGCAWKQNACALYH